MPVGLGTSSERVREIKSERRSRMIIGSLLARLELQRLFYS